MIFALAALVLFINQGNAMDKEEAGFLVVGSGNKTPHLAGIKKSLKTMDAEEKNEPDFIADIQDEIIVKKIEDKFNTIIFENLPSNVINKKSMLNAHYLLKNGGILVMNYPGSFLKAYIPEGEDNLTNRSSESKESLKSESTNSDKQDAELVDKVEKYKFFSENENFCYLNNIAMPSSYDIYKQDQSIEKDSFIPLDEEKDIAIAHNLGLSLLKDRLDVNNHFDISIVKKEKIEGNEGDWQYDNKLVWIKLLKPAILVVGMKKG